MNPALKCFLSSHFSFFNHLVADCLFFPINGPHNAKSGPFMKAIVRYKAGVGTELNENAEINDKGSKYSVGVLRVLRQGEIGKTFSGSFWKRDNVLFSELNSVLKQCPFKGKDLRSEIVSLKFSFMRQKAY